MFDNQIFNVYFVLFPTREQSKKTTAQDQGKIIVSRINSVINTRFPKLFDEISHLTDNRHRVEYSMSEIIVGTLFMFIFKQTSRNSYNNGRRDVIFAKNYQRYLKLRLPHPDTIDDVLRILSVEQIEKLKAHLVGSLIEQKCLRKFRFLGFVLLCSY